MNSGSITDDTRGYYCFYLLSCNQFLTINHTLICNHFYKRISHKKFSSIYVTHKSTSYSISIFSKEYGLLAAIDSRHEKHWHANIFFFFCKTSGKSLSEVGLRVLKNYQFSSSHNLHKIIRRNVFRGEKVRMSIKVLAGMSKKRLMFFAPVYTVF